MLQCGLTSSEINTVLSFRDKVHQNDKPVYISQDVIDSPYCTYIVIDFRQKTATNTWQKSFGRCVTIRLVDNFMGPTMCVALFIKKLFAKTVETRPGQPGRQGTRTRENWETSLDIIDGTLLLLSTTIKNQISHCWKGEENFFFTFFCPKLG